MRALFRSNDHGREHPDPNLQNRFSIEGIAIFLSSRAGAYTVGEVITCDGGQIVAA